MREVAVAASAISTWLRTVKSSEPSAVRCRWRRRPMMSFYATVMVAAEVAWTLMERSMVCLETRFMALV